MGEIICLHIGQAGIQMGDACWELFCAEHNLQPDGTIMPEKTPDDGIHKIFSQSSDKFVARSVFIDLEPTCIDKVRTGPYKDLFDPKSFVAGKEDSGGLYTRGRTIGKELADTVVAKIAREVDKCVSLQGFLIFNSINGGTGSGFGSEILSQLNQEYRKTPKFALSVFPSNRMSTSTVEPYNAVLSIYRLAEELDVVIPFENEKLYNICMTQLDIERPTYSNINRLIAQTASSLTVPSRFEGPLNMSLREIFHTLVPYPHLKYIMHSYSPLIPAHKILTEEPPTISSITDGAFIQENCMIDADLSKGQYIAAAALYRGDVSIKDAQEALTRKRKDKKAKFIRWFPTGFKIGINSQPPIGGSDMGKVSRALSLFSNSNAFASRLTSLTNKFDKMHSKQAFKHWLIEGLEDFELEEARDRVLRHASDYQTAYIEEDSVEEVEEVEKPQQMDKSKSGSEKELSTSKNELAKDEPEGAELDQQQSQEGDADNNQPNADDNDEI